MRTSLQTCVVQDVSENLAIYYPPLCESERERNTNVVIDLSGHDFKLFIDSLYPDVLHRCPDDEIPGWVAFRC